MKHIISNKKYFVQLINHTKQEKLRLYPIFTNDEKSFASLLNIQFLNAYFFLIWWIVHIIIKDAPVNRIREEILMYRAQKH